MPTINYSVKKGKHKGKKSAGQSQAKEGTKSSSSSAVTKPADTPRKRSAFLDKKRIRRQHVLFFTRQLLTLYRAGIPIAEGLGIIAQQESHPTLKEILYELKRDVEEGLSLSNALSKHRRVFPVFYTGVVEGGEQHGVLEPLLERLIHYIENEEDVSRSIKSALRYPIFVLITLGLAFISIMGFIFPRFQPLFVKFGDNLPPLTKVLVAISNAIRYQWMFLLGGALVLFILFLVARKKDSVRQFLDLLKFRIPLFGTICRYAAISRFANMFSTFFAGGMIDVLNILDLISKAFQNVVVKKEIDRLKEGMTQGRTLGESMDASKVFPPLFAHLIHVGEKTGSMEMMTNVLYEHYERDMRDKTQRLIGFIEPIMLFASTGFILLIALGIFMPYWRLMEVCK